MRALNILKQRKYLIIFLISSLAMLIIYPSVQAIATGGLQNLDLWFSVIPKVNLALVILFSFLFGVLLTLQIYNFSIKTCPVPTKAASAGSGGIGALIAIAVPACPACLSLVSLLLPAATAISVIPILIKYNIVLLLISIALMLLGLYLLGGFKKNVF